MPALTAGGPAIVHFIDFAQLNSVRTLPYLNEWSRRYREAGLSVIGVQAPRFPFGAEPDAVAAGLAELGVEFPVAIDAERDLWSAYGCEGWPSLFLWSLGGALAWVHFGEGEYRATEEAIQEELREIDALRELPEPMDAAPAHRRPRRRGDRAERRGLPRRLLGATLGRGRGRTRCWPSTTRRAASTSPSRARARSRSRSTASGWSRSRPVPALACTRSPSTLPTRPTASSSAPPPGCGIWSVSFAAGVP